LISTDDFLKDFQILQTAPIKGLHHKFIIKKNLFNLFLHWLQYFGLEEHRLAIDKSQTELAL